MRRPATVLREAFVPGDPVSLAEAAAMLDGDEGRASRALSYLASQGYYGPVRQRLWVRSGSSANPYRVGARITAPYALAYGTALGLHGGGSADRSQVLVASPHRFDAFEYEGTSFRAALPWAEDGRVRVSVGPEFVWATSRERTLVECVRVPANAGGLAEIVRGATALGTVDNDEVLAWVDFYGEANLAARVGFVLEATRLGDAELLAQLERRRPQARFYLEPGRRGGRLVPRWNMLVPEHLLPVPASA
jgi:predicted transcriptional regulator of viral defense system